MFDRFVYAFKKIFIKALTLYILVKQNTKKHNELIFAFFKK
jgi:hypothetical protein